MPTLLKYQYQLLLIVVLITAMQGYFASQLQFDYNIEHLFPKNDPELQFHRETEQKFAFHQDYLILGIENKAGIFNASFLQRLDSLTKKLQGHELIKYVNAPTNLRYYFRTPFGIKNLPFLHPGDSKRYPNDSTRLHRYTDVAPKFISRKHTAICSYIFLTEALNDNTKEEMRSFVQEHIMRLGFDKHYLYGDIYAKDSYIKELESEMYVLSGLSLLVIFSILFLTFRSIWGVIIPIIIVILTTVWTLGTLRTFGVSINLMTVLIPTVVSIISLSDVIHVMNRFNEQYIPNKQEAIGLALKDMRIAILLTSITTGLGFITLSYSNIQPFIEFGIFTTIGVAYAYLLAIFVLPLLLNLTSIKNGERENLRPLKVAPTAYQFIQDRPRFILLSTLVILLLSFWGMSKLKINSYLYEELSAKDTFSETLNFFENHFTGIRTFDLHLQVADTTKSILDRPLLEQIEQLETYLLEVYGLNEIYTIGTQVKRANRVAQEGSPDHFVLPSDENLLKSITDYLLDNYEDLGLKSILTIDQKETKITGKIEDFGSSEIRKRNRALNNFIANELDPSLIKTKLTGSTLLLDKSNKIITYKLLYGLLFAVLVVSILMGSLFRSVKITLIAIIPNILPLLMILGIIGWAEIGLKMSTAIIFTIAFGISVDDTIHFLSRLKSEYKKGNSMDEAIKSTYLSTGKAILITSIILILGFGVLLFSSFQTTFITGLLVSLALLFALFADLVLLPVLLFLFFKGGRG